MTVLADLPPEIEAEIIERRRRVQRTKRELAEARLAELVAERDRLREAIAEIEDRPRGRRRYDAAGVTSSRPRRPSSASRSETERQLDPGKIERRFGAVIRVY